MKKLKGALFWREGPNRQRYATAPRNLEELGISISVPFIVRGPGNSHFLLQMNITACVLGVLSFSSLLVHQPIKAPRLFRVISLI